MGVRRLPMGRTRAWAGVWLLPLTLACAQTETAVEAEADPQAHLVGEYYAGESPWPVVHLVLEPDGSFWAEFPPYGLYAADATGRWRLDAGEVELTIEAANTSATSLARRLRVETLGEDLLLVPLDRVGPATRIGEVPPSAFLQGSHARREERRQSLSRLGITAWNAK